MASSNQTRVFYVSEEINIGVRFIPLTVHLIGLYALRILRKQRNATHLKLIQQLSFSEVGLVLLSLIISAMILVLDDHAHNNQVIYVLTLIKNTGFSLVYYCMNILITLDRLAEMKLNIQYPNYITQRAVNLTLWVIWACALAFTMLMILFSPKFNHISFCYLYFFSTMEFAFLIIALVTYTYILKQYIKMKMALHHSCPHNINKQETSIHSKKQKNPKQKPPATRSKSDIRRNFTFRFLFSRSSPLLMISLLVISFILFMMLPDLLNFVYHVRDLHPDFDAPKSWPLVLSTYILYTLAYTSDALIYILLQKDVRRILIAKFRRHQFDLSTISRSIKTEK